MAVEPSCLQKLVCFRELSEENWKAIAQLATAECFYPGHILFEEGKPGKYIYALRKGRVEILYNIGEEPSTRVDLISREEIIGCCTLVSPYVYTSTARSLTQIEVLEIDAGALRELMREDCSLGFAIQQQVMKILLDRIINFRLGS